MYLKLLDYLERWNIIFGCFQVMIVDKMGQLFLLHLVAAIITI